MKYFKYMTNMRNDLFIKELRLGYGLEGKAVWDLMLEIYAEACGNDPGQPVTFDFEVFRKEIGISRKKMEEFLHFFAEKKKILFEISGKKLILNIPKMQELRDEWTRKLRSESGPTPAKSKELRVKSEEEHTPPTPSRGGACELEKFSSEADAGAKYLAESGNPSMTNPAWVRGFLRTSLAEYEQKRPDLSPDEVMACWRRACDSASEKGKAQGYLKSTFAGMVKDFARDSANGNGTGPPKPRKTHAEKIQAHLDAGGTVRDKIHGFCYTKAELTLVKYDTRYSGEIARSKSTGDGLCWSFLEIFPPPE